MISARLTRTLLIGLVALALSYFVAERWPSKLARAPVEVFCSSVVANQPVQQVLAEAANRHLSTMVSGDLIRIYSVAGKNQRECHIGHRHGLVTVHRLVPAPAPDFEP